MGQRTQIEINPENLERLQYLASKYPVRPSLTFLVNSILSPKLVQLCRRNGGKNKDEPKKEKEA